MAKNENTTGIVNESVQTARFVTKRTASNPGQPARSKQVSSVTENFERLGKGRDVVFSGDWKPGRVLSSK
jgi:hypothetical protein